MDGRLTPERDSAAFGGGTLRAIANALPSFHFGPTINPGRGKSPGNPGPMATIAALPNTGGNGQVAGPGDTVQGPGNGKAAQVPTLADVMMRSGLINRDLPALQQALPAPRQMTYVDALKSHLATLAGQQFQQNLAAAGNDQKLRQDSQNAYYKQILPLTGVNTINPALAQSFDPQYFSLPEQ